VRQWMPLQSVLLWILFVLASLLVFCCICAVVYTRLLLKRVGVDTSSPPSDKYVALQTA
jgi:hypothetical protein